MEASAPASAAEAREGDGQQLALLAPDADRQQDKAAERAAWLQNGVDSRLSDNGAATYKQYIRSFQARPSLGARSHLV